MTPTLLSGRDEIKRAFSSGGWLGIEQLIRTTTGLLVGLYVARHLGPEQFGLLAYATGLMFIVAGFVRLALGELNTRNLIDRPATAPSVIGSTLVLRIASSILGFGALLVYAWTIGDDVEARMAIVVIGSAVLALPLDAPVAWFMARQRVRPVVLARITGVLLCAGMRIGFVLAELPLVWFAWPIAAEGAIGIAIIFILYMRIQPMRPRLSVHVNEIKALLTASLPLIIATFVNETNIRLPQLLLMHLGQAADVGQYAAAIRISEGFYFLPVIACTALIPAMTRVHQFDARNWEKRTRDLYTAMFWGGVAIAVPLSVAAPWLIALLFGSAYQPAARVLQIHAWSLPLVGLAVARGRTLIVERLLGFNLLCNVANLLCAASLAWILIPPFGAVGAAWASVLPQVVSVFLLNFAFSATRSHGIQMLHAIRPLQLIRRICLARQKFH